MSESRCSNLRFLSDCIKTPRGFQLITFCDHHQQKCALQQSSAIDDTEQGLSNPGSSYVWLGVGSNRMHLHREHVQELITVLQGWLQDGKIDA
jgi:hypothetical protein